MALSNSAWLTAPFLSVSAAWGEETAGNQVSGIDSLFLRDTVVVVGVGKLGEKLTDVLQILDTADGPRQVLVSGPGSAGEQHAQQSGPDGDKGCLSTTH